MNKYFIIPALLSCFLIFSCSEKKMDCPQFRKGKFLLKAKRGNHEVVITRDSTIQTELDRQTDTLTGEKIFWTGNCRYDLVPYYKMGHYSDTTNKDFRAEIIDNITALSVNIIATHNDYYVFEASKEGISFVYRDTLWIIH